MSYHQIIALLVFPIKLNGGVPLLLGIVFKIIYHGNIPNQLITLICNVLDIAAYPSMGMMNLAAFASYD